MALTKVSSSLVSDNAITTGKLVDGGVHSADIATNAITSTKIAQNSILTKHIDDGQVTTAQLGADAVTAAKIADDAISEEHLDVTVITGLTEVTAATGDLLMVADISDSNNLKKIPVSSILAGTLTNAAQTNITSLGTLTSLNVDTISMNGSSIGASGNLTLDVAGDIILDADGQDVLFKDGGTQFGSIRKNGNNIQLMASIENGNITFHGDDGGSPITALALDMSEAGAATFNGAVTANAGVVVDNFTLNGTTLALSSGDMTLDVAGDIVFDADGGSIHFYNGGTDYGQINLASNNIDFHSERPDGDIRFFGNDSDGGGSITALTLDMSNAGAAKFNGSIIIEKNARVLEIADAAIQWYSAETSDYKSALFRADDYSFKNAGNSVVATISSTGAITSKGNIVNDIGASGNDSFIEFKNTGYTGNVTSIRQNADSTRAEFNSTERPIYIQAGSGGSSSSAAVKIYANQQLGLTIDSSKNATFGGNATFAGTISSGAITSTGTLTLPGSTAGTRTIKDSYASGALANQGFLRSSGGNYWAYSAYQDGSANWKSAVSVASERSVYAIDEDTAYWSHAPSQTVSIGSDLTTQPTKKVVFDLENTRVGIGTDNPNSPLHVKTTNQSIQVRNTGNDNVGLEIYRDSDGAKGASIGWGNGNANLEIKNYRNDGQSGGPYANIDFFTGGTDADTPDFNPTRRMRIQQTGEVGIGTDDPTALLHLFKGESGAVANNTDSSLVLENSSHTYINFLTPASKEAGILWGDDASANTGMITYSHVTDNMVITAADDIVLSADTVNVGNNKPVWSGSYGGALFLKGNNATSDRYARICTVDSTGAAINNGLTVNNNGSTTIDCGQAYALIISGNNNGLRFSTGTNQRIYWNTHRALEGSADGSVFQVGEGFTKILNQGREVWVADGVYHFKLSKTISMTGNAVTRHELNINTLIGAGTGGTLRYEVSIVGYGSGGSNGLNARYSVGGYSGHSWSATNFGSMGAGTIQNGYKSSDSSSPDAKGLSYHPAINMGAYINNGQVYAYSPGAQRYGFTVSNDASNAMGGILTVEGVYT